MSQDAMDRRQHPRFRFSLDVTVLGGQVRQASSGDISQSGIFIFIQPPIPLDTAVAMTIVDTVTERQFEAKGRVMHILEGVGNGVQFTALSQRAQQTLVGLLEDIARQHALDESDPQADELPAVE